MTLTTESGGLTQEACKEEHEGCNLCPMSGRGDERILF